MDTDFIVLIMTVFFKFVVWQRNAINIQAYRKTRVTQTNAQLTCEQALSLTAESFSETCNLVTL